MSINKEVYIVAAARTPIGSFGGSLAQFSASQLGAFAIKSCIEKAGIDPNIVDEVLMGCVVQAGLGQGPARQAAKWGGLPDKVICTTVNKVCASGMKAITQGVQSILLGDASVVIAGGMESMTNAPYYMPSMRWGHKYGNTTNVDGLALDGLIDVFNQFAMGNAAEICARERKITREAQDAFAIESYKRSQQATLKGKFKDEIVGVTIPQKKGDAQLFDKDEEIYAVNFDKIPQIKPAFEKDGTVTAANASPLNDGAAAIMLMDAKKADALGLKPLAVIRGYADAEQAPANFTTTNSIVIPKALQKAGIPISEVDYFELNEAFSVVGIVNAQLLGIDRAKLNVHGGAVSLGHPLGCSGARIIVTLVNILQQNKAKWGVASISNGGGGGTAVVIENTSL